MRWVYLDKIDKNHWNFKTTLCAPSPESIYVAHNVLLILPPVLKKLLRSEIMSNDASWKLCSTRTHLNARKEIFPEPLSLGSWFLLLQAFQSSHKTIIASIRVSKVWAVFCQPFVGICERVKLNWNGTPIISGKLPKSVKEPMAQFTTVAKHFFDNISSPQMLLMWKTCKLIHIF